jgi:hypothetical protein
MSPSRWRLTEQIVEAALRLRPGSRRSFVRKSCADDESLYKDIESLLAQEQDAACFLETPAHAADPDATDCERSQIAWREFSAGINVGPYRVLSYLGGGGMGQVYRATDTRLGRDVALKFISGPASNSPQALERFKRESQAASSLNHPNICTLYDIGEYEGRPFLVIELLDGQSLRERLAAGVLPMVEAVSIAMQILAALDALHAKGIVHRDVKPANIFVTPSGQAKLVDLGLAKSLQRQPPWSSEPSEREGAAASDATITRDGSILGTAAFMSPEQARGEEVDTRTDLFSLGGALYQMATGHLPFTGSSAELTIEAVLQREPVKPRSLNPQISPELEAIILTALRKDRAARYSSAAEMRSELERVDRPASWKRIALLAATGAAVTLLVFGGASFDRWRERPATAELVPRQISANRGEDRVHRAALSADGEYIAYTDLAGIHVRHIDTGETRVIPPPVNYCFR